MIQLPKYIDLRSLDSNDGFALYLNYSKDAYSVALTCDVAKLDDDFKLKADDFLMI